VDGVPAEVLPADYLIQGVSIPRGTHVVDLVYRDPLIAVGLVVSGVAWALLIIALVWLWRAERRRPAARATTVPWPTEERTRL
jgi:hypothetical protein